MIGFGDAKPALTSIGFGCDAHGGAFLLQIANALAFFVKDDFGVLQLIHSVLCRLGQVLRLHQGLTVDNKAKRFAHGLPTRRHDEVVAIVMVTKAKQHHASFDQTVLTERPTFRHFSGKQRSSQGGRGAWNRSAVKRGQPFRLQFVHAFWCPTFHSVGEAEVHGTPQRASTVRRGSGW